MRDRFTKASRRGRGHISRATRRTVYQRDQFTCQYCRERLAPPELTIDHLVPLNRGGLDEVTNYVTCCAPCNQKKANLPLKEFAASLEIELRDLPIHGDPVIDNEDLPKPILELRRRIFHQYRQEQLRLGGKQAQKKLEKAYRRCFWETEEGKALESMFPALPGHARIMVLEIKTIADNAREFWLLVELAKSANTRNLIGTLLTEGCDVERRFLDSIPKTRNEPLRKRMEQALARFDKQAGAPPQAEITTKRR